MKPHLEVLEDRTVPATLPINFSEIVLAAGLSNSTAMEISPDDLLFVAEQSGTMEVWQNGAQLQADFFTDTPLPTYNPNTDTGLVDARGERGLLGIAFDPEYASNRNVYVYYTAAVNPDGNPGTPTTFVNRVSRFTANATGDLALSGSEVVVMDLDPLGGSTNHNGGALHFGPDGMLYIAVGDAGTASNAQSLDTRFGSILRIAPDGSIPNDNPFFGVASGANQAIWAFGLRNPFTFTFQPGTDRMHINDVGDVSFEEINVGQAGANYGWPDTEGDFNQSTFPNFTRPFYAYGHGGGLFEGFAITGGAFYNPATPDANRFPADFSGDYFFADFVNNWINVIDINTNEVRRFASNAGNPVDLRVDDTGGLLYLSRSEGRVYRVRFEDANTPNIAVGADAGGGPHVRVIDAVSGTERFSFFAYEPAFTGGVRVATGDVNGDDTLDVITAAGAGGGPHIKVFDGTNGVEIRSVFAYDPAFSGGVFVASGDVDDDGFADIITGPGAGGGPHVRVFSGLDGSELYSFFAYEPAFIGGVTVAGGNVNNSGGDDIITGGGPHVKVFDGENGAEIRSFLAYNAAFTGGIFVAAGDVNGDGFVDIITGASAGGGPHVKVFNGQTGAAAASFFAFDSTFTGGVRVGSLNFDSGDDEIIVGSGSGAISQLKIIDGLTGDEIDDFFAFNGAFAGGVFVG